MKEFVEKLIERLEELKQTQIKELCEHKDHVSEMQSMRGFNVLQDAIKIVEQLASEHNNGWILCEERLPEEYGEYLCCDRWGEYIVGYPTARVSSDDFYVETEHEIMNDCIAWQPLPAPYKKGE